ncbi:succinate-semialdehyde dehydrogenase/glutarate-semialdehyde dehydrogenase [Kribbella sp. VKM Ac-2527]|uniref:Succinate-semialdehyde dehydrogenase/glutarate-semialdehyde dehydrogenase n=1 Tax=Kribbella caucasensis TaxID=2512215 RepID=A0A4V3C6Q8_9ACTN|nr:NAD-dependent succinate-semialdehyde dehydrogenase [Kribbella sp. VKM Ac-2527]TDO34818.1 succinate-semialdehyde dehydrogenase/glutarate-semialdehyde dehydrogenase [Kribbella sp. VKM Ac-2527]
MTEPGTTLIDGQWHRQADSLEVIDPADGSVVDHIGWSTAEDAVRAADAAADALTSWADAPARQRSDILLRAADLITARAEEIGTLLAREAGKRLPEAIGEVSFSAEYFRWFAEEARRPSGHVVPHELADRRHLTIRRPVGVVATLTPWNFPCSIQARKLAPALAAGCTVVARVSEKAPLAVTEMIRCLTDAGIPRGVVNLVHGPARELTGALLEHRAVRAVSFTGSTGVGAQIMAGAARRIVRPLLELGGDAAFIVFEDADLDAAVEGALLAKFRNTGQSCIAANRFIVHEDVYDEFVARLVNAVDKMTVGNGLAEDCPDLGPVIDAQRAAAVEAMVKEAVAGGARLLTRSFELPAAGSYVAPALLADVPDHVALAREEVFGPVAGIFRFRDEDEAIARANATEMGLAGYFWSRDVSRGWRVAERLETGIVGINNALPTVCFAPMGGVKQSGLGREGGSLGLEEFQDVRYLAVGV